MIDLIQLQKDVYGLLMSAPQLATVNIVEERKFIMQQEIEMDALWQTVRQSGGIGYSGCGLLVEIPAIECESTGVTGPPQTVTLSFVSVQNGDAAFTPPPGDPPAGAPVMAGSGLFAEQIEQFLLDLLQLYNLGGIGTMKVANHFSEPARDYAGLNARRTRIVMTPKQTAQTARVALVIITVAGGNCTLSTTTPGATIYYTLGGSFPSNPTIALDAITGNPVNPHSTLYTGPFAVQAGQLIRATAYLNAMNPSPLTYLQN